jgi:hypothetical protein
MHPDEVLLRDALPFTTQDVIKGYTLNLSLMAGVGMALKAIKEDRIEEFMKPNEDRLKRNSHRPLSGQQIKRHGCSSTHISRWKEDLPGGKRM